MLLLDRKEDKACIVPLAEAVPFLRKQLAHPGWLEPPERTEPGEGIREVLDLSTWEETTVDPRVVAQARRKRGKAVSRMLAFLDRWTGH
jgi:hypothetical protein